MKKYFMLSVDQEFCTIHFEDFICKEFDMDVSGVGCGTVEFICSKKPRNFEKRLKERFGSIAKELSQWMYIKEHDDGGIEYL